ncbi:hypothetical protein OIV83_002446 [Microbotryomycetes sp. JL201]|nr:hypothetical protein OIV83_002446 [Microbotryomycetes sp. JL201]
MSPDRPDGDGVGVMEDVVYGAHPFEAENSDELSFRRGERIIVLQRDEDFGDGWYEGKNEKGEQGLFPQSYTSPEPPSPSILSEDGASHGNGPGTATPSGQPKTGAVEQALAKLEGQPAAAVVANGGTTSARDDPVQPLTAEPIRRDSTSVVSIDQSSMRTKDDDESDEGGVAQTGAGHRALLAAKAQENAEKEAREEQERKERRQKQDTEAYERARREGLIEDLQLSDESDDEQGALAPAAAASLPNTQKEAIHGATVEPTPNITQATSLNEQQSDTRPRADTETSAYAESTYSVTSDAGLAPTLEPVARDPVEDEQEVLGGVDEKPTSEEPTAADSAPDATPKVSQGPTISGSEVFAAGVVGAAAVGGGAALARSSRSRESSSGPKIAQPTYGPTVASSQEGAAKTNNLAVTSTEFPSIVPALPPPVATNGTTTPPAATSESTAVKHISPLQKHVPSPINTAGGYQPSPIGSAASVTNSQTSSRGATAPLSRGTSLTSMNGPKRALPSDAATWSVEDVVEWGRQRGFDGLTLSKFEEHEISGDVLLEMDVAMLKEIDLVAFGRRVHIYNAIKELKNKRQPKLQRSSSLLSPSMSGYEPDSPGGSVLSPPGTSSATFGQQTDDLHGLGLDDDSSSRPNSSRRVSGGITPQRSKGTLNSSSPAAASWRRSGTVGTDADTAVDESIPEEAETDATARGSPVIPLQARPISSRSNSMRHFGRKSDARSDISNPTTPDPSGSSRRKKEAAAAGAGVGATAAGLLGTLGRSRKPPPRVPSGASSNTSDASRAARPRPLSGHYAADTQKKRSTRFFGSFGGHSGSDKGIESIRKSSTATLVSRDGPSSMTAKTVDAATGEMIQVQPDVVADGENVLEKIGTPDHTGWMRKKGEKYNTWKQRFFILKGLHLYYLKSESASPFIDPSIHPGEYAFKIVHETERTHYFSAAEQVTVRTWMKEIMKATIGRDYSDAGQNPNTLSPKDAQILMEFAPPPTSPKVGTAPSATPKSVKRTSSFLAAALPKSSSAGSNIQSLDAVTASQTSPAKSAKRAETNRPEDTELVEWINSKSGEGAPHATDLGPSLSSGYVLTRLLESLSGKESGIKDSDFAKYKADQSSSFDPEYFDTIFNVFDYMSPLVSTDEISMDDMLSGNRVQLKLLVERIRSQYGDNS